MSSATIGVDPHKRSATIEIADGREQTLDQVRFGQRRLPVDRRGRPPPRPIVGGRVGGGAVKHIAQRLVADSEPVLGIPTKLAVKARAFDTGHGRKTDATNTRFVAPVTLRTTRLHHVNPDDHTVGLWLLVDRRDELGRACAHTVNRLHKLLTEPVPSGTKVPVRHPHTSPAPRDALTRCRGPVPDGNPPRS